MFRGGIYPPKNKKATKDCEFSNLAIPRLVYISLIQHIGDPAKPIVSTGDIVEEGSLIAVGETHISGNIHSSVTGRVVEIAEYPSLYGNSPAIVIELHGSFTPHIKRELSRTVETVNKHEILEIVKNAGIVGLGGAAFPAHVKLSPPSGIKIDTLVINGSECEPYLTVDDMLMKTFPDAIIEGIRIIMKALNVKNAVIGIEKDKPKAIKVMEEAASAFKEIAVKPLKPFFPQGGEKQIILSTLGREVPSRGLPMDVGATVFNVGTVFAIREAVLYDRPLTERYITVSGDCIKNPGNYKVKIGTRIADVIEECGGLKKDPVKIVLGGPMCGIAVDTMEISITKGISGILVLSEKEIDIKDYMPCVKCGKCVAACPMGLLPCEIANAVEILRYDVVEKLFPFECISCGSCAYICPSKRPISHFIKVACAETKKRINIKME